MPIIPIGADGFYHPKDEDEIIELIKHANQNKLQVRVRGAAHSVNQAIFADAGGLNLMLDQMNKVEIDKRKMQVTVQAGCHLGRDPYDPAGVSNLENSLLHQLDQKGLAVPDLGGIIHQAVGGFVSTGSSGGSLHDSFGEAIIALTLIDGTGKKHQVTRAGKEDLFFAAGVSMGLLGIITEVTFRLVKKFDIKGEQTTTTVAGCEVDLFGPGGNGKPSLQEFLIKTPYTRLMWWPQNGVERMVIWKAHQMQDAEYDASTGTREIRCRSSCNLINARSRTATGRTPRSPFTRIFFSPITVVITWTAWNGASPNTSRPCSRSGRSRRTLRFKLPNKPY
jgi:hypothetical protein